MYQRSFGGEEQNAKSEMKFFDFCYVYTIVSINLSIFVSKMWKVKKHLAFIYFENSMKIKIIKQEKNFEIDLF